MKRVAALIALTLILGASGSSAATGPAVHALLQNPNPDPPFGVWRDGQGRYTFEDVNFWRYDPSRLMVTEFSLRGKAVYSIRYVSDRAAWLWIEHFFGSTKTQVMRALKSGTASAEPADYAFTAPLRSSGHYEVSTDYGTNIARMAKETRLTLPRLASLGRYPLTDASWDPTGTGWLRFDWFSVEITLAKPGHTDAEGNRLRQLFDNARHHSWAAGVRYAVVDSRYYAVDRTVIFPYHGEWISIDGRLFTSSQKSPSQPPIIRAILVAPTAG